MKNALEDRAYEEEEAEAKLASKHSQPSTSLLEEAKQAAAAAKHQREAFPPEALRGMTNKARQRTELQTEQMEEAATAAADAALSALCGDMLCNE